MENDVLIHWGVKGMKWGVRRYQNSDGSLTPAGKKRYSDGMNFVERAKAKKKAKQRAENLKKARAVKAERKEKLSKDKLSIKEMTDKEIQDRINRLEMEKKYASLVKESRSLQMPRGKKFIEKYLDSTVDRVADQAAADLTAQAIKVVLSKGINKAFGEEEVFTNNKKK